MPKELAMREKYVCELYQRGKITIRRMEVKRTRLPFVGNVIRILAFLFLQKWYICMK